MKWLPHKMMHSENRAGWLVWVMRTSKEELPTTVVRIVFDSEEQQQAWEAQYLSPALPEIKPWEEPDVPREEEVRKVLSALLEWEERMGGLTSPCWEEARALLERLGGG